MTMVIGLAPNERGAAAVHLGSMLARSISDDVVVVTVVPSPWPPNPYRVDAGYLDHLTKAAEEALGTARTLIGPDLSVELVTHHARSVPSGLLDVARDRNATLVALGSSSRGVLGLVSLGGVAERILHSSDTPVTLAPRGFDTGTVNARVSRITVAFGRADKDSDLLLTAASVAEDIGATLRVAYFAVRPLTAATGTIEPAAEDLMVREWAGQLEGDIRQALSRSEAGSVATPRRSRGGARWLLGRGPDRCALGGTGRCWPSAPAARRSADSSSDRTPPRSSGAHRCRCS
jgi:nucleotide-binding universal stress UspA family protein